MALPHNLVRLLANNNISQKCVPDGSKYGSSYVEYHEISSHLICVSSMVLQRTFGYVVPLIIIVFSSDMGHTGRKGWPPSENLAVYRIGVRERLPVFERW